MRWRRTRWDGVGCKSLGRGEMGFDSAAWLGVMRFGGSAWIGVNGNGNGIFIRALGLDGVINAVAELRMLPSIYC